MTRAFTTEAAMFAAFRADRERKGYSIVGTNMPLPGYDGELDMVTRRELVDLYEGKLALSWDVCAQAFRWLGAAHRVWCVVPGPAPKDDCKDPTWLYQRHVLERDGIGLIHVTPTRVVETVAAKVCYAPTSVGLFGWAGEPPPVSHHDERCFPREAGSPGRGINPERQRDHARWIESLRTLLESRPKISVTNAMREIGADERFKAELKANRVPGFRVARERIAVVGDREWAA